MTVGADGRGACTQFCCGLWDSHSWEIVTKSLKEAAVDLMGTVVLIFVWRTTWFTCEQSTIAHVICVQCTVNSKQVINSV